MGGPGLWAQNREAVPIFHPHLRARLADRRRNRTALQNAQEGTAASVSTAPMAFRCGFVPSQPAPAGSPCLLPSSPRLLPLATGTACVVDPARPRDPSAVATLSASG